MKHSAIRAVVHNVADSLACGISLATGFYEVDVYGDARRSQNQILHVDLLNGRVLHGEASEMTLAALACVPALLQKLLSIAGARQDEVQSAEVTFRGQAFGASFTLIVKDLDGRRSETDYAGIPAQRVKELDPRGRIRPRASRT